VKERPSVNKSMLASKTLPTPIRKDADTLQWIRVLSTELAVRLAEARDTGPVWPKTIVLHTKQGNQKLKMAFAYTEIIKSGKVLLVLSKAHFPMFES